VSEPESRASLDIDVKQSPTRHGWRARYIKISAQFLLNCSEPPTARFFSRVVAIWKKRDDNMRRVFLFSVLTAVCVNAAYATTDIESDATTAQCVEPTLHRYEGTANLQAQWEANKVPLRWYNNHTLIALAANNSANDCDYSGALDTPTDPTRTGYTFAGWRVNAQMNFSQLDTSIPGTDRIAKCMNGTTPRCLRDNTPDNAGASEEPCTKDYYTELNPHEWKVHFSYGDVYGMAKCSNTTGTYAVAGTPSDTNGQYCWCKATTYKPLNQSTVYRPLSTLAWVFRLDHGSASNCAYSCALNCASLVRWNSDFRAAVFAPAN